MREFICACSRYRNQRQNFETFGNNCGTPKVMDGSPLIRKTACGHHQEIQGQGCFTKRGLLRGILPVMWMGFRYLQGKCDVRFLVKVNQSLNINGIAATKTRSENLWNPNQKWNYDEIALYKEIRVCVRRSTIEHYQMPSEGPSKMFYYYLQVRLQAPCIFKFEAMLSWKVITSQLSQRLCMSEYMLNINWCN